MDSRQRYISNELTHFVGRADKTSEKQYETLTKILREGKLMHSLSDSKIRVDVDGAPVRGIVMKIRPNLKLSDNDMFNPEMVCFCDIPVGELSIHVQKHSSFGISFRKEFIVNRGGAPVYYVPKKTYVKIKTLTRHGRNAGELFDKLHCGKSQFRNG